MEGDTCPKCGGKIHFAHGIEVGNTFKLGTKYSKAMDLQYLDSTNKLQYVWMCSYGIGPGRAMAALAEQNADENGINWPAEIAPYQVAIVIISMKRTHPGEQDVSIGSVPLFCSLSNNSLPSSIIVKSAPKFVS